MKISEMKIKRTETLASIEVIRNLMKSEDRMLTTVELEQVEELTRNIGSIDANIKLAEQTENERKVIVLDVLILIPETIMKISSL